MSRARLQELGVDVPVLPATAVGSLPKPPELVEARAQARRGAITAAQLDEKAREATAAWIAKQEELGLDILVDGQQYRGEPVTWFAGRLKGFREGGLVRVWGNRYYRKPVISGEVRWPGAFTVEWWRFAQGLTKKPVKGILTGPYTLMDWSFNERYPSRRAACLAIARELRREADALVAAGCRVLQIDEPAFGARPDELGFAADAIRVMTKDLGAYTIAHVCYAPFESLVPSLVELAVDNLDLECANSDFAALRPMGKSQFPRDLSLGVIDVVSPRSDTPEGVLRRVRKALTVLKPERIWVDPDCGLGGRTTEEAVAGLAAIAAAVQEARKARGG